MDKIIAVGGGPASVLFAYQIKKAHPDCDITILESDNKILKRVLISGNGRSNFFNEGFLFDGVEKNFSNSLDYKRLFSLAEPSLFLKIVKSELGLPYYSDKEGRIYPFSNISESLRYALTSALAKVGIKVVCDSLVTSINPDQKTIVAGEKTYSYDALFLGLGGYAYDRINSMNKKLITGLDVKYIDADSALCPVKVSKIFPNYLNGTKLKGILSLLKDGNIIYSEEGELLFKKDGLSGICVFNSSLYITDVLFHNYEIAFNPFIHDGKEYNFSGRKRIEELTCFFPSRFVAYLGYLGFKDVDKEDITTSLLFPIKEKYGLEYSQISLGGISTDEIDINMSLKKYPNIFVGGEMIDLHAICGGFNMGSAFLSGMIASKSIN